MSTENPPVHRIRATPPGRRSIVASSPNQAPRPSAVVSAAHTALGGCASSTVRSMRSGNPITASNRVATNWLLHYRNRMVASTALLKRSLPRLLLQRASPTPLARADTTAQGRSPTPPAATIQIVRVDLLGGRIHEYAQVA